MHYIDWVYAILGYAFVHFRGESPLHFYNIAFSSSNYENMLDMFNEGVTYKAAFWIVIEDKFPQHPLEERG